jgi:hypothetical protein
LGDADQHPPTVAAVGRRRVDQRAGRLLLALPLSEVHHGDPVGLGEAVDVPDIAVADPAERRRRRDLEPRCQRKNRHTNPTDCNFGI